MVASRMPRMNKMWKVAVMSVDVVARTTSVFLVSSPLSLVKIWFHHVHVATIAASDNAESTQSKHCDDPAWAAT
jgi:hypothetical protein